MIQDIRLTQAKRTKTPIKAIHLETDQFTSAQQQQQIHHLYSSSAWTFPRGIKMRLVPPLRTSTSTEDYTNATQLTSLQAHFLAHTTITQRCDNGSALYNSLWKMTTLTSKKNQPGKPLFHDISWMAKNEGYIVRYLPQYNIQAWAAIAQLSERTWPKDPVIQPRCKTTPSISKIKTIPTAIGHLEEIEKRLRTQFSNPFCPGTTPSTRQPSPSIYPETQGKAVQPSNHKLQQWLGALRKLFQNTAWDKWWNRIGVQSQGWDHKSLMPGNTTKSTTSPPPRFPVQMPAKIHANLSHLIRKNNTAIR